MLIMLKEHFVIHNLFPGLHLKINKVISYPLKKQNKKQTNKPKQNKKQTNKNKTNKQTKQKQNKKQTNKQKRFHSQYI